MNKTLNHTTNSYLLVGLILAIITAIMGIYSFLPAVVILIYIAELKWGDKTLIFLSIFLYLTFISDIIHSVRVVIQIIGFILLAYIFIRRFGLKIGNYPHLPPIFLKFIVLFYSSMFISSIFSKYWIAGMDEIIKQSIFFLIIFMIYSFLDRIDYIKTVLSALAFATVIVTISILYQYIQNGFELINYAQGTQIRITGIMTNINAAGSYFGALFPVSLITISFFKKRHYKYLFIALNIFLFVGIILTTSRSAYLSILVSILFISYMFNKKIFLKLLIGLLVIICIILFVPQLDNVFTLFFRVESGISQRDHLWALSLQMFKDHPFFGIGPGAYSFEMINYFPVLLNSWIGQQFIILRDITFGANNSHNFFIFFASDMGILGIITSIVFPVIFLKIGINSIKKYKEKNYNLYKFSIGLVGAGLGLFFRGIFEGIGLLTYGWITMDLPFWIIFSILISLNVNDFLELENNS